MKWYRKVSENTDDLSPIVDAIIYYEKQAQEASQEVPLHGLIEKASRELPGITEHRMNQFHEISAIERLLEIRMSKVKGIAFKKYLELYNRQLSSRDAEKYADADDSVLELALLINHVSLIKATFTGIMKGLEAKQWQITNMVKLKVAGFEDFALRDD